jgi:hypothetical protein
MKLSPNVILQLATMICGDEVYKGIFPYRSSSYLTQFFHNIDLDYRHDSAITRKWWVQSVLEKLNNDTGTYPSEDMTRVITHLLDPVEFKSSSYFTDYNKAVEVMNELLRNQGLHIEVDEPSGNVFLKSWKGEFISTAIPRTKADKVITFCPIVFNVPDSEVKYNLVSVMMPFLMEFQDVYTTIKSSCHSTNLECNRVDDIWKNSVIIQDIFDLIYSSSIVIADLSGRNPNVLYEVGIAHTLGKHVIPIVQNIDDIPYDLRHHRALEYCNNNEGRTELKNGLESRLETLKEDIKRNKKLNV